MMSDNKQASMWLKPGKERALKNRHPWIFSGAIRHMPELVVGSEVLVLSHEGEPLAIGHYCSPSGLSIRVCTFDCAEIIDASFWQQKFHQALALRTSVGLPNAHTSGFRLVHAEGDGLSGLICDIFGSKASIQLSNPGLLKIIPELKSFLQKNLGITEICFEEHEASEASFLENSLHFVAHMGLGQKTGHFLDQRQNRALVGKLAKGRRVLDAFCYSGGFSVYALAGGAKQVTSVDISHQAIAQVSNHVAINGPFAGSHEGLVQDCFNFLRTLKPNDFDCIILDPPAFAKSLGSVEKAARGYKDINLQAMKALGPESLLFSFSCSQHISMDLFKKIIFAAAKDSGRDIKIIYELSQGADHPVSVYCPQSSYLKGLALYVA